MSRSRKLFGVALGLSMIGLLAGCSEDVLSGRRCARPSASCVAGAGGSDGVAATGAGESGGSAGTDGTHPPRDGGDVADGASGSAGSDTGRSCSDSLDLEGCACASGSAPRSCYTGDASQAGIGSCTLGTQACGGRGDKLEETWGACIRSGAPTTCAAAKSCGATDDGCGGLLDCGTCEPTCVPRATPCANMNCGTASDGCGGVFDCGTCAEDQGQICGGATGQFGGINHQCGSCATSCEAFGAGCGSVFLCDGSGGEPSSGPYVICGTGNGNGCPAGQNCVFTDMVYQRSHCE